MESSDSTKSEKLMIQFNFNLVYKGEKTAKAVRHAIEKAEAQLIDSIQKDFNSDNFLPHFRWHVGVGNADEKWFFKVVASVLDYVITRTQPQPGPVAPPPPPRKPNPPLASFDYAPENILPVHQHFI